MFEMRLKDKSQVEKGRCEEGKSIVSRRNNVNDLRLGDVQCFEELIASQ